MSLSTGEIIDGKYRIVRLLGEGGMGAVYEGENLRIHRRVAIKVLHSGVAEMADAVQRFEREAQAAGRIGSEHIVEVLDLGNLPNSDRYMVMEFLEGESLSSRIQSRGRLIPAQIYPIAAQLLDGLAAAHGAGIIHRDLKPDNVYLLRSRGGRADFVKLLDFGISKFNQLSGDSGGFSMTRTGAVMGTPYYMAPEQAKGARDLDHRVDLYAAGVILYECLTGRVPFNANTFNELLFKIVLEQPPPIEELVPDVDPAFAAIVRRAMARERDERYATCVEFRQALDAWASANPGLVNAVPTVVMSGASAPVLGTGTPTPGTWAQTGGGYDPKAQASKKKTGLIVGLAVAAVVAVAGAGVALKLSRDSATARAAAAAASAQEQAKAEREQKDLEEEQKKAELARQEADRLRAEAQKALDDAKNVTDTKQRVEAEKAAEEKVQLAQRAETTARTARAAATQKTSSTATDAPAATATAKSKPATTQEPSVAGRKIRTSL